jgi:hypothetical protein
MQSAGLGRYARQNGFQRWNESQKEPEIRSKLNGGFGKAGVKGRDERKERALDTVLPKQTLLYALFTAKGPKKSLDKADAVIHGATLLLVHNQTVSDLAATTKTRQGWGTLLKIPSEDKQTAEKGLIPCEKSEKHTSGAKATADSIDFMPGIYPRPTARGSFSAACKVMPFQNIDLIRLSYTYDVVFHYFS